MRKIMIVLVVCLLAGGGLAARGEQKSSDRSKTEPPAVDCSTVDDATITASVKDKFLNTPSLKNASIQVETRAGAVTLTGVVKTSGMKSAATRMTRQVACVKQVNNQLEVEQKRGGKKSSD